MLTSDSEMYMSLVPEFIQKKSYLTICQGVMFNTSASFL